MSDPQSFAFELTQLLPLTLAGRFRGLHRQNWVHWPAVSGRPSKTSVLPPIWSLVKSSRVPPLLATVHPFTTLNFEGNLADPSGRYRKGRAWDRRPSFNASPRRNKVAVLVSGSCEPSKSGERFHSRPSRRRTTDRRTLPRTDAIGRARVKPRHVYPSSKVSALRNRRKCCN